MIIMWDTSALISLFDDGRPSHDVAKNATGVLLKRMNVSLFQRLLLPNLLSVMILGLS